MKEGIGGITGDSGTLFIDSGSWIGDGGTTF